MVLYAKIEKHSACSKALNNQLIRREYINIFLMGAFYNTITKCVSESLQTL